MQTVADLVQTQVPALDQKLPALLADALRGTGYAAIADAVPPVLLQALVGQVNSQPVSEFDRAGVGREADHQLNSLVRRDRIRWIEGGTPAEKCWLAWTAQLRLALNRQLLLGLFSFESHFAHYAPGAFYRKHLDSFREPGPNVVISQRVLSLVTYLNPDWGPDDGGELVIYDTDGESVVQRVTPLAGTLVVFLSAEIPHEVLPARRDRYSIAGWFRVNGSHADRVDPPT
jgi:SM-20-related protein